MTYVRTSSSSVQQRDPSLSWMRVRRYRHFDVPVGEDFARRVMCPTHGPALVARHSFCPLIHYEKVEPRYKKTSSISAHGTNLVERRVERKRRPIKYASHKDACIYSWYAHQLSLRLEDFYRQNGLSDNVIAYRALGKSNYDFAAAAYEYAKCHAPVTIIALDIKLFFDTLDHKILKKCLKTVLGLESLPKDWFAVFKSVTRYHYVDLDKLKEHPTFGPNLRNRRLPLIATVAELKREGISFKANPEATRGIPQGTPISAVLSNLYMIDFDLDVKRYCERIGGFYRRYSDDVIVICDPAKANDAETFIKQQIEKVKLSIEDSKTERTLFDLENKADLFANSAQYLGFKLAPTGPTIREKSLARAWRKMRRAIRKTRRKAQQKIATGQATKVFTRKLYRRFSYIRVQKGTTIDTVRNFCSYARHSAKSFDDGSKILRQVKRFEKAALAEIKKLKSIEATSPNTS